QAGADRARVLLRRVDERRPRVVDRDVIDLLGRLVVPRAPRRPAVERDDGALIVAEQHALAVGGIDPQLLRVVAAGRAFEAGEGVAAVGGFIARGVDGVDDVGVLGVHVDAAVVAALAVANARVGRVHLPPRG